MRRESGEDRICLAYLQMAEPSLANVARNLDSAGTRAIRILPMLISAGNHAEADIPAEVAALRKKHPQIAMEILPPIGSHPRFKTMMRELVGELL